MGHWFEPSTGHICGCGGIGRRTRFRFWRETVGVQIPYRAPWNPCDYKGLRPKGQKVNSGLKPIRGKQESRSQKRLPLSCFFWPAVLFAERIKASKKYRKQSKKFVFITILCYTVYNRRLKRRTFRFSRRNRRLDISNRSFRYLCKIVVKGGFVVIWMVFLAFLVEIIVQNHICSCRITCPLLRWIW